MAGTSARQLALDLPHRESLAREDFLAGPANAAALAMIERWPDWPDRILVLVGPAGSGKSHLAAIWGVAAGARFLAARAFGMAEVSGALATGALVLEDAAAGALDERALFHLLNLAREEEAFVLVTAATAPSTWAIHTPDLASRLRAVPVVSIEAPDDALRRAVLVKLFADRQVQVEEGLIGFLLTRTGRSLADARAAVVQLDAEALRLRRPVTRALAAELFRIR